MRLLPRLPKRVKRSTILVIDEVKGPWDEARPAYWRAEVPTADLEKLNPRAYGAYRRDRSMERRLTWMLIPATIGIICGGLGFVGIMQSPEPLAMGLMVGAASVTGIMAAAMFGLPFAWMAVKLFLPVEYMYVLGRVPATLAAGVGLPMPDHSYYGLIWATPPPLLGDSDDDTKELASESQVTLWRLETLLRGVDGWSTENYLMAVLGELKRRDAMRGMRPDQGVPIAMDRVLPNEAQATNNGRPNAG
jgi:hypothetical protein